MLYQYLFESSRKLQLRGILLNIYLFNLKNFTKLCPPLATFVNTQETFQRCVNVAVKVIWCRDVVLCQINVETTLCMPTLGFTTLNNVKSTLSISALILATLDNIGIMLLFSTLSFTTLINVETDVNMNGNMWIWPFSKTWKEGKKYFWASKTHLINNTYFWLRSIKKKGKHGAYNVKINNGK